MTKESNKSTQSTFLIEEIDKILKNSGEDRDKKNMVQTLTISYLKNVGKFLKSDVNFYYFYDKTKILYDIKSSNFKYTISNLTGLNIKDPTFVYLIKGIETYVFISGNKANLKEFSYYNEKINTLYVFNNGNSIIKITKDNIDVINNGDEGVIFIGKDNYKEWIFNKDVSLDKNYLDELIKSVNFIEGNLNVKEQNFIIKNYIFTLFFPDLFFNRPIITFIGDKGSGKSFFLEVLLKIFFGGNIALGNLPTKEDDFKTMLMNEYLCYFDNVDDKVSLSKVDIMCSVATGGSIKIRKLYSNGEQIEKKLNCFLGFTSRNPSFKRDDIVDRMIVFNLDRRKEYESSNISQKFYIDNRDLILSNLCYELQGILKNIEVYENNKTNFRISDFSNFILNIHKSDKEKINNIFDKLELDQHELTTSTDNLLLLLESLLEETKENIIYGFEQGEFYTARELHYTFSKFANDNREYLSYGFNSPKSLGKSLNNNKKAYKSIHNIDIRTEKYGSNITKYSILKKYFK